MLRMLSLVRNENLKLYKLWSTRIMAVILVVVVIAAAVIIKTEASRTTEQGQKIDWRTKINKENDGLKKRLQEPSNTQVERQETEKELKINEYRLEHDIPPLNEDSLWRFVLGAISVLFVLISVFTIVVGASSVASEFSNGTIKMLLIRPYRRWKILLAKYISTLLFAVGMMCLLFVSAFLVGGISFGFNGLTEPYLAIVNGQVVERAMLTQVIIDFGFSCVGLLLLTTMAFMISSVFRTSSLSIGLGIFLMLMGEVLVQVLSKYSWVKYVLFTNLNLRMYFDGIPPVEGMTLGFSIIVLSVYFLLFNFASFLFFSRRDIA